MGLEPGSFGLQLKWMLGFKSLYRLTLFPSNPPLQLSLLAVCGSDDSCGEGLRLVWRNVCLPLIYYSLHGGGLYSGSLSVIFSMTSFDLRPPPLWGGFDFDLGCLLGAVPPCLLEVGLHLKGKGCIAAKRRDVITNKLTDSYVFPERTYSAFSLLAAAAESWSILTPPSSLQNIDREPRMKLFSISNTTLVSHWHRQKKAFISTGKQFIH